MSARFCFGLLILNASCMTLSQNVRPTVLEKGEMEIGVGLGFTRDVADDFAYAPPTGEEADGGTWGLLTEVSLHYGLTANTDIGVRARPFTRGGKLEVAHQLIRQESSPVSMLIGIGVDGFYRPRLELDCRGEHDGCFNREYWGLALDLPIVIGRRVSKRVTLFAAVKYMHLYIDGDQRYKSTTGAFPTLVAVKTFHQPIFGWAAGVEFRGKWIRLGLQANGATLQLPDGSLSMIVTPSLDFGVVF